MSVPKTTILFCWIEWKRRSDISWKETRNFVLDTAAFEYMYCT